MLIKPSSSIFVFSFITFTQEVSFNSSISFMLNSSLLSLSHFSGHGPLIENLNKSKIISFNLSSFFELLYASTKFKKFESSFSYFSSNKSSSISFLRRTPSVSSKILKEGSKSIT